MKLLIDNQLPIQLAIHLRGMGDQCEHVLDAGLDEADDLTLWTRAARMGQIVWVRLGNCRNASLLAAFDQAHENIVRAIESGQRIIELR